MAPSKRMKKATGDRPSRLLNLNKSPRAQKLLASTNAADSRFLRLPPEIRCRIYDFAFSDRVVRVRTSQVTFCQSSEACQIQHRQHYDQRIVHQISLPYPRDPSELEPCQAHKISKIPVHLLQVCRQVYHEAALKPFTQPTFDFFVGNHGINYFLAGLVPGQARAITHIRLNTF
jgi:hypothetical protein